MLVWERKINKLDIHFEVLSCYFLPHDGGVEREHSVVPHFGDVSERVMLGRVVKFNL